MTIGFLLLIAVILTVIFYYIIVYRPEQRRAARVKCHRAYLKRRERLLADYEEFKQIALFAYRIRAIERIKHL